MSPIDEAEAVDMLARRIGYGRVMQLCEQLWRQRLIATGLPGGGEHTTGPCAAFMVRCQCVEEPSIDNRCCDWCCGARRVTTKVRDVQRQHQKLSRLAELAEQVRRRCYSVKGTLTREDRDLFDSFNQAVDELAEVSR